MKGCANIHVKWRVIEKFSCCSVTSRLVGVKSNGLGNETVSGSHGLGPVNAYQMGGVETDCAQAVRGSAEMLPAHFLTHDRYRSRMEGRSTPMILSADLIVRLSVPVLVGG